MAKMMYTLHKNDGSGVSKKFAFAPDSTFPDAAILFNESTLEFVEWNESADGTSTSYFTGDVIPNAGDYYAIWETPDPVTYTATDKELKSIANAIRTKGNTSAQLQFPTGFVSAIEAISTGITPTGTKQIAITQNGTTTEDVTNYANAAITVAIPVYTGEIIMPVTYNVTVSLTNPRNAGSFAGVTIHELTNDMRVGNRITSIPSATGSVEVSVSEIYGICINLEGYPYIYPSGVSYTGGVRIINDGPHSSDSYWYDIEVTADGTITMDGIDWDF